MKDNKKVVLFSLLKDKNIGDAIIGESAIYLCKRDAPLNNYFLLDLKGRCEKKSIFFIIHLPLYLLKKILRLLKMNSLAEKINDRLYDCFLKWYLSDCKLIIFAGGGIIETEHYNCAHFIFKITKFAEKNHIPIVYNSVGFNGVYDSLNPEYIKLKECLHSRQVASVSVRENLNEMKNKYQVNAKLVSDVAVWSSEAYGIQKKCDSRLIGVNIIRPGVFNEFGISFSEMELKKFYIDLIHEIEKAGFEWQVFTNGALLDEEFAEAILSSIGAQINKKAIRPTNGRDFLKTLSSYGAVFCVRMHASICSYSLKIPTVALFWNPKQKYFYENSRNSENLFFVDKLNLSEIVHKLCSLGEIGWDNDYYDSFRMLVSNYLRNVLYKGVENE